MSFQGDFTRENNIKNNKAEWNVNSLNTGIPNIWEGSLTDYLLLRDEHTLNENKETLGFGVKLMETGDHYKLSERASKYTILILVLNFLAFLIFEMKSKVKIHIVQYLLVGLSICLFYLLLLSISEYVGFHWAYLLTATIISTIIFYYTKGIFCKTKPAVIISSLIAILYTYVYIILKLTDSALITGTIGLTLILIAVMSLTKDLNKQQE